MGSTSNLPCTKGWVTLVMMINVSECVHPPSGLPFLASRIASSTSGMRSLVEIVTRGFTGHSASTFGFFPLAVQVGSKEVVRTVLAYSDAN